MRPSDYVEGLKNERQLYTNAHEYGAEATCTVGIALLLVLDMFWVRMNTAPPPVGRGPALQFDTRTPL